MDRQAGAGEHAQHGRVVQQRRGGERGQPAPPGQRHQVLEQQRGDAAVVHVVGTAKATSALPAVPTGS